MSLQGPPKECILLNGEMSKWLSEWISRWQKVDSDGTDVMSAGRLFQMRRLATGKAMPIVDSSNGGTTRWLVPAERRDCRPGRSATRTTGSRYSGAVLCRTLNVKCWHNDLVDDALRDAQPVQADQHICYIIKAYKSAMRLRSAPTGGDVPGVSEDWPARCFRSQVWIAPERPPMIGTWPSAPSCGSDVVDGAQQSIPILFVERATTSLDQNW